jgi:WD40 repeat protein
MSYSLQAKGVTIVIITIIGLTGLTGTISAAGVPNVIAQSTSQPTCVSALAVRLSLKTYGVVTPTSEGKTPFPVQLHTQPDNASPTVAILSAGAEFLVISGPVCANTFNWWQVITLKGDVGWLAEGDSIGYLVDPVIGFPPAAPISSPTVYCPPDALTSQLAVGMTGVVLSSQPPTPVRVRKTPNVQGEIVTNLVPGDQFLVMGGPQRADGYVWWKIQAANDNTIVGWAAEGDRTGYFIAPIVPIALLTPTPSPAPTCTAPPTAVRPLFTFASYDAVTSVAFSPDSKSVVTGSFDSHVMLWDVSNGQQLEMYGIGSDRVTSVVIAPDSKTILLSDYNRTVVEFDGSSGGNFSGPSEVTSVAVASNGKTILTGNENKTAILWDAASGDVQRTFSGHTARVTSVAFAPNGKTILTGSWDKTAILWDVASGQAVRIFRGHADHVTSVAFAPDGKTILTGSDDHTAILWDAASGQALHTFRGHTDEVSSVAFAPDGKTILTGSYDHTAILWNVASGQVLRTFRGHTDKVASVAFAPNGKTLLTGSYDHTAILWDISDLVSQTPGAGPTTATSSAIIATSTATVAATRINTATFTPSITPTAISTVTVPATRVPTANPNAIAAGSERTDSFGIKQVYVPAGCFLMGSDPTKDSQAQPEELPQHQVCLTKAYWLDEFDVTNFAFKDFVSAKGYANDSLWSKDGLSWKQSNHISGPSDTDSGNMACIDSSRAPNQPHVCVNYYEAEAYAKWRGGSLPTEAQWEYAARGPKNSVYPWGDTFDQNKANTSEGGHGITTAIDAYPSGKSWVGAYDMAGNVWQWVSDGYSAFGASPKKDPTGPSTGQFHGLRGGSTNSSQYDVRSAYRYNLYPNDHYNVSVGFRLAVVAVAGITLALP